VDDVLDLRPYLRALRQDLRWILVVSLLLGIAALVISIIWPATFEATALVVARQPNRLVQFDPRFETVSEEPTTLAAYPELALSDDLLQAVWDEAGGLLADIETLENLRDLLSATTGSDHSLLRLSVQNKNAETAAQLANVWAELFITRANQLLGNQDESQLTFFEDQRDVALTALNQAEQALVDYQAENRGNVINSELSSLQTLYSQYLEDMRTIDFLRQDVTRLLARVDAETTSEAAFGDQFTALLLQVKVYNAETTVPLELQLDGMNTLSDQAGREQAAFLDSLLATLEDRSATAKDRLVELEPEILALQQAFQIYGTEYGRLERNQTVAAETYLALARQVEQERITVRDTSIGLRLASYAAAPTEPVSPRIVLTTSLGGLIGLMMAGFVVLFKVWWQQETVGGG